MGFSLAKVGLLKPKAIKPEAYFAGCLIAEHNEDSAQQKHPMEGGGPWAQYASMGLSSWNEMAEAPNEIESASPGPRSTADHFLIAHTRSRWVADRDPSISSRKNVK